MELEHENILLSLFSILYFCNHLSNSFILISTGIYILVYIFFSKNLFSNDRVKNNFVSISLYIIFNLFSFITSLISLMTIGDKQNRIFTNIPIKRIGHILSFIYLIIVTIFCVYKIVNLDELNNIRIIILACLLLLISYISVTLYPKLNVFTNNYKCHNLSQKNITQSFKCNTFLT